jgi:hypothetical protein
MIFIAIFFPFCFSSFEYWMYVWIEFLKSSFVSFLVKSLNPYRVSDTLCRAARQQTLDNLVLTSLSKDTPSLTWPTFIMFVGHLVCNLGLHWWEVVSNYDLAGASSSLSLFKMLLRLLLLSLFILLLTLLLLSFFIPLLSLLLLVLPRLRHLAYVFEFESLANHIT